MNLELNLSELIEEETRAVGLPISPGRSLMRRRGVDGLSDQLLARPARAGDEHQRTALVTCAMRLPRLTLAPPAKTDASHE